MKARIKEFDAELDAIGELTGFDVKAWLKEWNVYMLKGGDRPTRPHGK